MGGNRTVSARGGLSAGRVGRQVEIQSRCPVPEALSANPPESLSRSRRPPREADWKRGARTGGTPRSAKNEGSWRIVEFPRSLGSHWSNRKIATRPIVGSASDDCPPMYLGKRLADGKCSKRGLLPDQFPKPLDRDAHRKCAHGKSGVRPGGAPPPQLQLPPVVQL